MSEIDDLLNPPPPVEPNAKTHASRPERLFRWYELFKTTYRYVQCSVEGCPGRATRYLRYCASHATRLMREKRPGKGDREISEALLADATETGPFPRPGHVVVNPATEKIEPTSEYVEPDPNLAFDAWRKQHDMGKAAREERLKWQ